MSSSPSTLPSFTSTSPIKPAVKQAQPKNCISASDTDPLEHLFLAATAASCRSRSTIDEWNPPILPMATTLDRNSPLVSSELQAKARLQNINNHLSRTTADDMNGHRPVRVPTPGVWAPAVTFYNDDDTLDLASQKKYYSYLSQHLTGLVVLGTNAETFLLTREERATLLQTARQAVGPDYEIMAGVGGHSTKQVLEFIGDAHEAGADYALVLPCAYFGKQTSAKVIQNFYDEVAEKSPLPILIYNFPGVCNGVDIESHTMAALHRKHKNIVGTKLTCASVGKITRLSAEFDPAEFAVFGGQADFLVAGLAVGSAGAIAAFANVCPKVVRRVYDLYVGGKTDEALKLHRTAAFAEVIGKSGIANTKYAASLTSAKAAGIEGAEQKLRPRRPYEPLSDAQKAEIRGVVEDTVSIERSL